MTKLRLLPMLLSALLLTTACPGDPECGNGEVEENEQCDDGNKVAGDGCENTCIKTKPVTCGNAAVDAGEECDDGNQTAGDGCENNCTLTAGATCGNGVKETGEECDDGNQTDDDSCGNDCVKNVSLTCGNSVKEAGEDCDDGNQTPGDGCENNCTRTPAEGCTVTAGSSTLLIIGDILAPTGILSGGQLVVAPDGKITCVAADCTASASGATVLDCKNAVVSPGLINAHDHITYTNNAPYVAAADKAQERFNHRHDWRTGKRGHTKISTNGGASAVAMAGSELRFVMGGATSTVSSGAGPGLLRNLDKAEAQMGLNQPAAHYETFPLDDKAGTLLADGCGYPTFITSSSDAYFPHVAEGVDTEAHNEFLCVEGLNGGTDLLKPNAAFIHGVAAIPPDTAWMALDGAKLVWSPRTNISLYGDTAPVTLYARSGAVIALGTDWTRSGSTSMLRELKCVADLNETYYDSFFSDEEIWKMATLNGAKAAAMDDVIGTLATGKVADISIFRKASGRVGYRAVIDAEPADVALVLRGGKALYGDAALVAAASTVGGCENITVCGAAKAACLSETNSNLAAIQAEANKYSPLFACDGAPPSEPTCQPSRSRPEDSTNGSTVYDGLPTTDDQDGDGIANAEDNCPAVFNPIRPMDNGKQPDFDNDGAGDACDTCPISANNANCPTYSAGDYDADGVDDADDNCFSVPNTDQLNPDGDARGSACDKCPADVDPCPALKVTVYQIKTGAIADDEIVEISGVVVTGTDLKGYFVQVSPNSTGYAGVDNSGLYIYPNVLPTVARGDLLKITGTVATFNGQKELTSPTATLVTASEPAPAPVVVLPAEVATGGAKATVLEGVLVRVENVKVTNANPDAPGAYNEFEVSPKAGGTGVRVNDQMFTPTIAPIVDDEFSSITGVLNWRNANTKIEPRDAADLVETNVVPRLAGMFPSTGFLRVGADGVATFPVAMKVRLLKPLATDTVVTVTAADAAVVPADVTIVAGQTEAEILFDGISQIEATTITAAVTANSVTGVVRVLGVDEAPVAVTLTPATSAVAPAGTKTLTVTLDIPAPAAGATVTLGVLPADAGTLPATVVFAADEVSKTFDFVAGATEQPATISAALGTATPVTAIVTIDSGPQPSEKLVINELMTRGADGVAGNEFLELYNGTSEAIDLAGYVLCYRGGTSTTGSKMTMTFGAAGSSIPAGEYFLLGTSVYAGAVTSDAVFGGGMSDTGGSAWLAKKATCPTGLDDVDLVDVVGWGSAPTGNYQGTAAPSLGATSADAKGKSIARKATGVDTDDNGADFALGEAAPQNLSSL